MNIYLIDDSDINNFYTEDILEDFDFVENITIFDNSVKALESITNTLNTNAILPDLLLLDIRMPMLDGFQFIDKLKELDQDQISKIKIFILSSSEHTKDLKRFKTQSYAQEYLNKPLEIEEFKEKLKKHFEI